MRVLPVYAYHLILRQKALLANLTITEHKPVPVAAFVLPARSTCGLVILLVLALFTPIALFGAQPEYVVIGDVHGAFDNFVAILQKTGIIDHDHHWTGGNITLVQVGDLLDRGPKPRQTMDLIMALQSEAQKAGGRVVELLGNHEIMNIMGDLRYVTPENYAAFADTKSEERRQSAWQKFVKWRNQHEALAAELPPSLNPTDAQWMAQHPAGFVEHREAFSPNGKYGKWLRGHSAVAKLGSVVFLHGGLDSTVANMGLDGINVRIHDEINQFDTTRRYLEEQQLVLPFFTLQEITAVVQAQVHLEQKNGIASSQQLQSVIAPFLQLSSWLSMSANSPVWFRGYDEWTDDEGAPQIAKILQLCDAKSIVVGHTVQKNGQIRSRFNGKVFLIDTGMLSSYFPGGKASALEIGRDREIAAEYMDNRVVLLPPATAPRTGAGVGSSEPGVSGTN